MAWSEKAVEAAVQAWLETASDYTRLNVSVRAALDAAAAVDGDAGWDAARDTCVSALKVLEDECETNRLSFVQTRNSESAQLALFERNIIRRAISDIRSLKRLK